MIRATHYMLMNRLTQFLFVIVLSFIGVDVHSQWTDINMTEGVTDISRDVFNLHMLIFYICVAIGVIVFGVMFYSMFMFTRKKNPEPAKFDDHKGLEILWTVIPFLILIGMAVPATNTLKEMYADEEGDINIAIPKIHSDLSPILTVVPLQLIAYHAALELGCDVDRPRNLAKSVTVE